MQVRLNISDAYVDAYAQRDTRVHQIAKRAMSNFSWIRVCVLHKKIVIKNILQKPFNSLKDWEKYERVIINS